MKIQRFIKFLNNTELGRGNTHETYIYINKGRNIDYIFKDYKNIFKTKSGINEYYKLNHSKSKEERIVGLGDYYRNYNLEAGDAVILERVEFNNYIDFFISHVKKINTVTFMYNSKNNGFEILSDIAKIEDFKTSVPFIYNKVKYNFRLMIKGPGLKRSDSPQKTNFYSLIIEDLEGNQLSLFEIKDNDMVELIKTEDIYLMNKIQTFIEQTLQI